jgi:hypothetical protein
MAYEISQYTLSRAAQLGVVVRPSATHSKKIDVFDQRGERLICSIGLLSGMDFPALIKEKGYPVARRKRTFFVSKNKTQIKVQGSKKWYMYHLLW